MNRGYTYVDRIRKKHAGLGVVDFYATQYPRATRQEWAVRIEAGQIVLNGRPATADAVLRAGDRLEWRRPPWEEPPVPTDLPAVFEDDDLIVFDKPAGMPVRPGGGFLENTAVHLVRARWPGAADWSPVHCLDRGTSGLLLFGKHRAALSALGEALRVHRVERRYLAVVCGIVERDCEVVTTPIGPVEHPRLGGIAAASPSGKPAETRFRILERNEAAGLTLVEAEPRTGRTHQIRIHAGVLGHPIEGDPFYVAGGGWDAEAAAREGTIPVAGDIGYRLHAWRLSFAHPRTRGMIALECAPPEGFWHMEPPS
jgi:23S rRNA pseudouridine1911/1915/1917 synthase